MTFWQTLLVVCFMLGGWLLYEALRAREAAIRITKEACKQHGLQLLDDTVHGVRLGFVRDHEGVVRLRRTFLFDFSGDLYGEEIDVAFVDWIRTELKFDRVEDLVRRMNEDAKLARAALAAVPDAFPRLGPASD